MKFVKMHGIGNDYVYIDTWQQKEPAIGWAELARRVSLRKFGVGSDGLILIQPPQTDSACGRMRMFNADGSESEMCGNGLRCVAKYLHDYRFRGRDDLLIDTGVGPLLVKIAGRNSRGESNLFEVDMGEPILEPGRIPATGRCGGEEETLIADERRFHYTAVGMGNPHCVIFVESVEKFAISKYGPLIENNREIFPNRVNVEFVEVWGDGLIRQRTWERGAGETLACGTGACAVAMAARLRKNFPEHVRIRLSGGELQISWKGPGHHIFLRGPASRVYEGQLTPELLEKNDA